MKNERNKTDLLMRHKCPYYNDDCTICKESKVIPMEHTQEDNWKERFYKKFWKENEWRDLTPSNITDFIESEINKESTEAYKQGVIDGRSLCKESIRTAKEEVLRQILKEKVWIRGVNDDEDIVSESDILTVARSNGINLTEPY